MTRALVHRGPDGEGFWFDRTARIGLGHRRLAIVDLSDSGKQPMRSQSGRYVITFNGEIYNFQSLRRELVARGCQFHGTSDTEIMLAAVEEWGVERAVERFAGMFAFALWDDVERLLYLVRDRIGKKPLYLGFANGSVVFGSELKALRSFPDFDTTIDRNSLVMYLRHNYVPTPRSIYESAQKIAPGTIVKIDCKAQPRIVAEINYWSPRRLGERTFGGSFVDAASEFENLLVDAVRLRMIADVPLGAFLSGGVDSSTIVALMARLSTEKVRTFTIGFTQSNFDEAVHARALAEHFNTDHTELYVTPEDARAVIPSLPAIYDEPFADSSQIPTFLVSQLARQHVTVSLSGDGGDELGAGYYRYLSLSSIWQMRKWMPAVMRRGVAALLRCGGAAAVGVSMELLRPLLEGRGFGQPREKLLKLADAIVAPDDQSLYRQMISHWPQPESVVLGAEGPYIDIAAQVQGRNTAELIESLMAVDTMTYLPDDILVKVDRASMAVSLEVRAPLLDHRLFELCRRMPLHYHLDSRVGKKMLRSVLRKYVPDELMERPKMGFAIPLASWLRGPLRQWAEDLLEPSKIRREGFFDVDIIRSTWKHFLSGRSQSHYLLWDVLMFQSWLDDVRTGNRAATPAAAEGRPALNAG